MIAMQKPLPGSLLEKTKFNFRWSEDSDSGSVHLSTTVVHQCSMHSCLHPIRAMLTNVNRVEVSEKNNSYVRSNLQPLLYSETEANINDIVQNDRKLAQIFAQLSFYYYQETLVSG